MNPLAILLATLCLSSSFALYGNSFPEKGLDMEQVKVQFGSPLKENPAIGKPAIIRWDYSDYSVYFENQFVIHSVPHQRKFGTAKTGASNAELTNAEVSSAEVKSDEMNNTEVNSAEANSSEHKSTELAIPENEDSNNQASETEAIKVEVIEIEETKSEANTADPELI